MKPDRIFLVRHGEAELNIRPRTLQTVPDWKSPLTERGIQQAKDAAKNLLQKMKDYDVSSTLRGRKAAIIYTSPWYRTRKTAETIQERLNYHRLGIECYEDPRLREQEWGNFREERLARKIQKERRIFGKFFYRMPMGESAADVYDRLSTFLETLHRDFAENDFPRNLILVTHGLTIKVFLTRFFHWSVETFDKLRTVDNCHIIQLDLDLKTGKYKLVSKLKFYE